MKNILKITTALTLATALAGPALAHDGRRFEVQVKDGKLVAQGYISGFNPIDDGNGIVRDYYNAIHAHWTDLTGPGIEQSRATLPGFDVDNQSNLLGDELWLTITGIKKWADAPFSDFAGGHGGGHTTTHSGNPGGHGGGHFMTHFHTIPDDESVQVTFGSTVLSLGTPLQIEEAVEATGHYDLQFDYKAGSPLDPAHAPHTALYLVEFQLSTDDSSILPSDTIHAILSPPGSIVDGSHGLSLATEIALGTPVPEPGTLAAACLLPALLRRRRA